ACSSVCKASVVNAAAVALPELPRLFTDPLIAELCSGALTAARSQNVANFFHQSRRTSINSQTCFLEVGDRTLALQSFRIDLRQAAEHDHRNCGSAWIILQFV